jgi:dihydrofolate reductase
LQEYVSVDGFAAAPDGDLGFFQSVVDFSEVDRDQRRLLEDVGTILLGAATYRLFVDFWPTADPEDEPIAPQLNTIPKVVISSTLDSAPWGKWPEATVLRGDAAELVTGLKEQDGGDIILWGSLTLAQSLLTAGLVDEIQLFICPIAIGEGRRLFPAGVVELELVAAKTYPAGLVSLRYRPVLIDTGR